MSSEERVLDMMAQLDEHSEKIPEGMYLQFCDHLKFFYQKDENKKRLELLELQRHYKRAQTEYVRPPSRKSAGRGKGAAAASAGGAGSGAAAAAAGGNALRPGWWKGARKIRSKALTWRILYCVVGWTLLLHRSVVIDPLLAALPEEGMALFLIVIVVPVVGVAAHQNLNLFQMPSMMEPPPGMEQADYWVDE